MIVNSRLTINPSAPMMTSMSARRRVKDRSELPAAIRRMVIALVRRATGGDDEALIAIADLRALTHSAVPAAARRLHHAGYSWTEVGLRLGISRQAAHKLAGRSTENTEPTAY